MSSNQDWFSQAADVLESGLTGDAGGTINGVEFLEDYIKEHGMDDIEYDGSGFSQDWLESQVTDNIDEFQEFLIQNCSWFSTRRGYIWELKREQEPTTPEQSGQELFRQLLNDDQKDLYDRNHSKLRGKDHKMCMDILRIARSKKADELTLAQCLKMVVDSYARTKRPKPGVHYKYTRDYATAQYNARMPDCAYTCAQSAAIASRGMYIEEAAFLYKKASEYAAEFNCDDKDRQQYLRKSRIHFHQIGDTENAGAMFRAEKDLELERHGIRKNWGLRLFKLIADYGESPIRVAKIAFCSIVVFAVLYLFSGISVSGPPPSTVSIVSSLESWPAFIESMLTCIYFSVVTFTTLGYGDLSPQAAFFPRFLAATEALWGLVVTSLFLTSLVRKYSRF